MNIILVSDSLGKSRTLQLNKVQAMLSAALLFLVFPVLLAATLYYFSLHHAANIKSPYLQSLLYGSLQQKSLVNSAYFQDDLSSLAIRVGKMQAQLLRLDALGERLTKTAGLKPQEFNFQHPPGQGGAVPSRPQGDLSFGEVNEQLQQLSSKVLDRSDRLAVLDALLSSEYQKDIRLPSAPPVMTEWHSSDFGVRIDPFTGKKSFHEGIDFSAEVGAPIKAAAAGFVVYSDYHHDYGNMIEIDHGNGLVSRYAHASQRLVKLGDVVLKGQEIAKVGSTGHSTGPHLHFEVRFKGVAQNPARFLQVAN